jgi:hypothetical protein
MGEWRRESTNCSVSLLVHRISWLLASSTGGPDHSGKSKHQLKNIADQIEIGMIDEDTRSTYDRSPSTAHSWFCGRQWGSRAHGFEIGALTCCVMHADLGVMLGRVMLTSSLGTNCYHSSQGPKCPGSWLEAAHWLQNVELAPWMRSWNSKRSTSYYMRLGSVVWTSYNQN